MKSRRVSDVERAAIIEALKSGKAQTATAKEFGRSKDTVHTIAVRAGIDAERSATKKATEAHRVYAVSRRLELNNELFRLIERQLSRDDLTPKDLRDLAVAYGIATDKRRLEEGMNTGQTMIDLTSERWAAMRKKVIDWTSDL